MTITRISPGVWELRTRHGTLIATGDLHTVVNVWVKLRRDGRSDLRYGHPRADGRSTSNAPAGTTADAARAPPANRSSRPRRATEAVRGQSDSRATPLASASRRSSAAAEVARARSRRAAVAARVLSTRTRRTAGRVMGSPLSPPHQHVRCQADESTAAPRDRTGTRPAPGRRYDESPVHQLEIAHAGTVWAGHAHTPTDRSDPVPNISSNTLPDPQTARLPPQTRTARRPTFTTRRTRFQASTEIRRLQAIRSTASRSRSSRPSRVARELNDDLTCSVKPVEVSGFASSATWSQRS